LRVRVQRFGVWVQDSRFNIRLTGQGVGFRVQDFGSRDQHLGLRMQGLA